MFILPYQTSEFVFFFASPQPKVAFPDHCFASSVCSHPLLFSLPILSILFVLVPILLPLQSLKFCLEAQRLLALTYDLYLYSYVWISNNPFISFHCRLLVQTSPCKEAWFEIWLKAHGKFFRALWKIFCSLKENMNWEEIHLYLFIADWKCQRHRTHCGKYSKLQGGDSQKKYTIHDWTNIVYERK